MCCYITVWFRNTFSRRISCRDWYSQRVLIFFKLRKLASMLAMMAAGTSWRSFLLRSGSITLLMPHRCAASICETSRSQEQDYSLCVEHELLESLSFFSNKQWQHFFYSCIEEPQKTENWWQKLQQSRHRKLGCVSVYHFTSLLFYTCMRGEEWLTIKLKSWVTNGWRCKNRLVLGTRITKTWKHVACQVPYPWCHQQEEPALEESFHQSWLYQPVHSASQTETPRQ